VQPFRTDPAGARVRAAIEAIAAGHAVVVIDDADREDEEDLIFAASRATPALVAFTVRHSRFDLTLDAYRAPEKLLEDGRVRAIGVSNFMPDHLTDLLKNTSVVPAVNQIEVHPYFSQPEVRAADAEHGILTQAWSPIGGITFYRDGQHGSTLEDPVITGIATAHGKTPAQVMLRWHLQAGRSAIPKSTKPHRIAENFDVFDFELTADEVAAVDALDTGVRGGPEPDAITLESFGRDIPEA
jgi:2,5-diketo-D-gluconate reductase A